MGAKDIIPFQIKPGQTLNPAGRPRRIYTVLKESGYSREDIRDAFEEIGWQTIGDLHDILKDDNNPAILKVIANAFIRGAEKGDFRYVSEILAHVVGKPKESIEMKAEVKNKIIVQFGGNGNNTIQ